MKFRKKGQVAFFIVAGVLLFSVVVLITYTQLSVVKKDTDKEIGRLEAEFSTASVENYITECLKRTVENGLDLMGKQGGYIYYEQGGEGLLSIGDVSTIPYLAGCKGIGSDDVCYVAIIIESGGTNILTVPNMEGTLSQYVTNQFLHEDVCKLDDVDGLFPGFVVSYYGDKDITATINANDVSVSADVNVLVLEELSGKREVLTNFKTNVNVGLQEVWKLIDTNKGSLVSLGVCPPTVDPMCYINNKIFKAIDKSSSLKGENYEFYFARE